MPTTGTCNRAVHSKPQLFDQKRVALTEKQPAEANFESAKLRNGRAFANFGSAKQKSGSAFLNFGSAFANFGSAKQKRGPFFLTLGLLCQKIDLLLGI